MGASRLKPMPGMSRNVLAGRNAAPDEERSARGLRTTRIADARGRRALIFTPSNAKSAGKAAQQKVEIVFARRRLERRAAVGQGRPMPGRRFDLPAAPFRFEMGLRRGDAGFFSNAAADAPLLAERRRWLDADPDRYAGATAGSAALLAEAVAFASAANPVLQAAPDPAALGRAWAPDFLLLSPDAAGAFVLCAGCVCFPSHWDLREKLGRPLAEIHAPVPTLHASLGRQIDTFLAALRPGAIWQRSNWGLAATAERNNHPARQLPRIAADTPLEALWLRTEQQAFTRLPATGGILFGIRIHLQPLPELLREPSVAARLSELLASMPDEIARYKGIGTARESLAVRLRRAAA